MITDPNHPGKEAPPRSLTADRQAEVEVARLKAESCVKEAEAMRLQSEARRVEALAARVRAEASTSESEAARLRVDATCRQAELGQLRAETQRDEAELLIETLFRTAPIGLAFLDRNLRYVRVNAWLAERNGRPIAEHIGRSIRDIIPQLADRIEPLCRKVLEDDRPVVDHEVRSAHPTRPDQLRDFAVHYYPVHEGGEVIGVGAIVEDVTERRRFEAERERRRALEMSMSILGHDLRNPLNAILLSASMGTAADAPEDPSATFERVARAARRMRGMIDQLLDVTRVRAGGGIPIEPKPANLHEIAAAAADELEAAHPDRRIERIFEGDANGCWDPDRMTQVVSNVVGNAVQHGCPNSPIQLTVRGLGPEVCLSVRNRGRPIPPGALKVIFDPFHRPSAFAERKGLGLGLFVVREVVTAHGGTVRISSDEQGTEVTIRLPRHRRPEGRD
jgi:PAS domain S-box-containing protein